MPVVSGVTAVQVGPATAGPGVPSQPVDAAESDPGSAAFQALPLAWQQAIRDAQAFLANELREVSPLPRVLVTSAPGNGEAPVTVVVPPGSSGPLDVHTHFHGDGARALAANPSLGAIARRLQAGAATVFVLPEANRAGVSTDWSNVRNIGATTEQALAATGLEAAVSHRVLSVHSAGGRALVQALETGEQLACDELVVQDALFEATSGRGAATALKRRLPQATAGVAHVTLVPSTAPGAAGLWLDLDEPTLTRTQVLARALEVAGRAVDVVGVGTHDDAAQVLESPTPSRCETP